jgi:uncharacterized protein YggE
MQEKPDSSDLDLLVVSAEHTAELKAIAVDARVLISGETFFFGETALSKAKEVAQFAAAVRATGVEEADIRLEGAVVRTAKGLLTKSSGADYTLLVHCRKLDVLGDIIGALAALKEARLESLDWRYNDGPDVHAAWLEAAARAARLKADRAAAGLGVRVVGLHWFEEDPQDREQKYRAAPQAMLHDAMSRSKSGAADFGMPISHTKRVTVRVEARFRVDVA